MDWKTSFQGKKILIAEDDQVNRDLMGDIFSLMNCPVEFALDGNQAVEKFKEGGFDLILMDIRMPNKDGIMATKEIRALENGRKKIPIIALTASILEEDRKNCIEAGIDDFVFKPIIINSLRETLAKYLL